MAQQKTRINIGPGYTPQQRLEIGEAIVAFIKARTKRGVDKNNSPFPGYSKEYIKSLDFKNAGKSRGNVNLKLSGDMMASLEVLRTDPEHITVGFEADDPEINARAEGNIKGTYGGSPKPGKKRDFLGIADKDKENILDRFKKFERKDEDKGFLSNALIGLLLRQMDVTDGDSNR